MKILVDTSIWSFALRRSGNPSHENQYLVHELTELISDVRVAIVGSIRQELLSGIASDRQFQVLKNNS